jgi:chromosome partitioning protein
VKTIAVVGAKGGTCKSASTYALGHLFAVEGHTVVLVDCDPQGTITRTCGLSRTPDPIEAEPVTLDLAGTDGRIRLLPGGRALEAADAAQVDAHLDRAASLGADLVLVDTPPALGPIVRSAMRRADMVLVPCHTGQESLDGFADVRTVAGTLRPETAVRAYFVLTQSRFRVFKWSFKEFTAAYPGALYPDIVVPYEVRAAEAATLHLPVTAAAPRGRATEAYRQLATAVATDLGLGTPTAPTPARV